MGFGPSYRDRAQAIQAVREIVALLYPDLASEGCLEWLSALAAALLEARAALSFSTMARFLADPQWRKAILDRAPEAALRWRPYEGQPIAPEELDPQLGQLLRERLAALDIKPPGEAEGASPGLDPPPKGED